MIPTERTFRRGTRDHRGPRSPGGSWVSWDLVGTAPAASGTGIDFAGTERDGGTVLKVHALLPEGTSRDSARRYPLIVLPTSRATPQDEHLAQARKPARPGCAVASYDSRAFRQSGGESETGGPEDIAAASRVLDWALARTPADKDRIGMGGVSYSPGISLPAAAHGERIKAVTALSG